MGCNSRGTFSPIPNLFIAAEQGLLPGQLGLMRDLDADVPLHEVVQGRVVTILRGMLAASLASQSP